MSHPLTASVPPSFATARALAELADRLAADERCTMLRLGLDEGDGLDNPLVQILAVFDAHAGDGLGLLTALLNLEPDALRLLKRLLALGCDGRAVQRRGMADTDDRAYLAAHLFSGEALLAAFYWPLPEPIVGLRAILVDPGLTEAARLDRVLALDPRAADWISCALAQGAHPDDTGRFYVAVRADPDPGSFEVVDRATNLVMALRRDRDDVAAIAAVLNAHPRDALRLVALAKARQVDLADLPPGEGGATQRRLRESYHHSRWKTAWAELGTASAEWRAAQALPADPWRAKIRSVA